MKAIPTIVGVFVCSPEEVLSLDTTAECLSIFWVTNLT